MALSFAVFLDLSPRSGAPWVAQWLRIYPLMQERQVRSLSGEDPLEREMATHSSSVA